MLSEWLAVRYADRRILQRFRVGSVHPDLAIPGLTDSEMRMVGVWRRWVDAIVIGDGELLVVEAGVVPDPGDVSQLSLYLRLLPATPELADYRKWPAHGVLLYAVDDPVTRQLAAEAGHVVEIYRPSWVDQYLEQLWPRQRRAPLTELPE